MTKISVTCPQGHRLQMSADYKGKQVRCPKCQQVFAVALQDTQSKATAMQDTVQADPFGGFPLPDPNTTIAHVPTSPSMSGTKKPTKQAKSSKLVIPAVIAVISIALIASIGGFIWQRLRRSPGEQVQNAIGSVNSSSAVDKTSAKIAPTNGTQVFESEVRYPRLPGAVAAVPEWVAKNAPFDAADFANTIPWEENAAPLYLEAIIEFTPEVKVCFPKDQQEELDKVSRGRRKAMNDFMSKWNHDVNRFKAERSENDNMEIDQLLSAYELGFAKLENAQKLTRCCFESGIGVTALIPHAQAMREVSRVLGYRAIRQVDRNDLDGAISTLAAILRASRDLRPRGFLVSQLVSVALDDNALTSIAPFVLNSDRCTAAHCDRMLKIIQEHRTLAKEPISVLTQLEYTMMILMVDQVQHRSGDFAPENIKNVMASFGSQRAGETPGHFFLGLKNSFGGASVDQRAIDSINADLDLMSPDEYENEKKAIGSWYTDTVAVSVLPLAQQQRAVNELAEKYKKSFFLSLLAPALIQFDTFQANVAKINGAICLAALKRWQLEGKSEPSELSAIMKQVGIPSVPIDPFSGEPMKLAMVSGRPVIYSVGEDRIDDMGQVDWRNGSVPGDILFKLQ